MGRFNVLRGCKVREKGCVKREQSEEGGREGWGGREGIDVLTTGIALETPCVEIRPLILVRNLLYHFTALLALYGEGRRGGGSKRKFNKKTDTIRHSNTRIHTHVTNSSVVQYFNPL